MVSFLLNFKSLVTYRSLNIDLRTTSGPASVRLPYCIPLDLCNCSWKESVLVTFWECFISIQRMKLCFFLRHVYAVSMLVHFSWRTSCIYSQQKTLISLFLSKTDPKMDVKTDFLDLSENCCLGFSWFCSWKVGTK